MPRTTARTSDPGMSDAAVLAKTGKNWEQWFKILDAAGAASLPHKQIAILLSEKYGVGDWWSQTVTVGYERARGLRAKHETARGFVANRSKTLPVPLEALFAAWHDPRLRRKWMSENGFVIRKATPCKSMRVTWTDDTNLEVHFYAKGKAKSQVVIQHSKLASAAQVERSKTFWGRRLEALAKVLAQAAG